MCSGIGFGGERVGESGQRRSKPDAKAILLDSSHVFETILTFRALGQRLGYECVNYAVAIIG
jgi:hypothetical protein